MNPYRYLIIDGLVVDPVEAYNARLRTSSIEFRQTGISARRFFEFVEGSLYPLTGYETDKAGVEKAAAILRSKFPNAVIGFVNAPQASKSSMRILSGFSYAGAMITLTSKKEGSDVLAINPLQILVREYSGRVRNGESTMDAFVGEITGLSPGLYGDIT